MLAVRAYAAAAPPQLLLVAAASLLLVAAASLLLVASHWSGVCWAFRRHQDQSLSTKYFWYLSRVYTIGISQEFISVLGCP